jgi:glutamate-1-semialdehyde aminotransferase
LIPAYSQTLAKGPTQYVNGVAPKFLVSGKGAYVTDADGNEYLDYNMGIGPVSLGYCYPATDNAIKKQLEEGIAYSLVHPLEVEVSELIREVVPNAESVRISKTGCDATSAAVRVARAITKRDKVLCCGYHGWHDWYIGLTGRNAGVPEATKAMVQMFNYNDFKSVEDKIDSNTACVILEPMIFDFPQNDFLQKLQALCKKNGALLIFDEMWTGFRFALGGAQEYFGVTPDLACYSKAVANGMPISFLTGKKQIMQVLHEDVFFFTTFGGEALSLAATKATINEIRSKNVPAHLAKLGKKIQDGYNEIAASLGIDKFTRCKGHPSRSIVLFDESAGNSLHQKSLVQQELIKRGILWTSFHNMSFSHTEKDVTYTLDAYNEVLQILKDAVAGNKVRDMILGEPVQPVFRKTN